MLETTALLRAQIAAKEVEIGAMRTFATERNPDLLRAQDAVAAMRVELARIEGATQQGKKRTPELSLSVGLDNVRLLRDVKYNEALYELLAKQYEIARIDEANDAGIVQVLDRAIEPDRRSKPRRTLIVIITALLALLISIVWALFWEAIGRLSSDPETSRQLRELRAHLRVREVSDPQG
jgi:tyrosine-protein kinase Etk/Wzc